MARSSVRISSDAYDDVAIILPEPCGPCKAKARDRPAQWYCIECDDYICYECKGNHESFKLFSDHQIISREMGAERKDLFKTLIEMESCKIHEGKKLEFFCPTHKTFHCQVCIVEFHAKCKTGLHVEDKNRGIIIGSSIDIGIHYADLQKAIADVQKRLETDQQDLDIFISTLPGTFKSMRDDILTRLDKAEAKAKEVVMDIAKDKQEELNDKRLKVDKLRSDVQSSLSIFEGSKAHGSDRQKIITERKLKERSSTYAEHVGVLEKLQDKFCIDIRVKPTILSVFCDHTDVYDGVPKYGKTVPLQTATSTKDFHSTHATLHRIIDVEEPDDKEKPWITGCAFLPDSSLLLTDRLNHKLKLYSPNFTFLCYKDELQLWDVGVFDASEFAVTLPDSERISRYWLSKEKGQILNKATVSVSFKCRGLDYVAVDKMVVSGYDPYIVYIVQTDGTKLNRIIRDFDMPMHVRVDSSKSIVYVSDNMNNRVCAIDLTSYQDVFMYSNENLTYPNGVAAGKEGNLFVCGYGTSNVHKITSTGQHIQIFLSETDGIFEPKGICVSPSGSLLVVTDNSEESVRVYSM